MISSVSHLLDASMNVLFVGLAFFIALVVVAIAIGVVLWVFKQLKIFPFN